MVDGYGVVGFAQRPTSLSGVWCDWTFDLVALSHTFGRVGDDSITDSPPTPLFCRIYDDGNTGSLSYSSDLCVGAFDKSKLSDVVPWWRMFGGRHHFRSIDTYLVY